MKDLPLDSSQFRRWALVGGGGHARSITDVVRRRGDMVIQVVTPAPWPHWVPDDVPVCGDEGLARPAEKGWCWVVAIGDCARRLTLTRELIVSGRDLPALVARSATCSPDAGLSAGAAVLEHAHIGPGTSVGVGALINTSAVVEHDNQVGDGVHVGPGAVLLGAVSVGTGTLVGSGARLLPGVRVGDHCVVGAGAVVCTDVPDGSIVTGVPARAR